MLIPLVLGTVLVVVNMAIQIVVVLFIIRLLLRRMEKLPQAGPTLLLQSRSLGVVVLLLFLGHVMQFAVWAALFVHLGEFTDFTTAFYHSAVNFTSLGYGDIVMSAHWRLLGGLEAANGVLMFGLSAGAILSLMNRMLARHLPGGNVGTGTGGG